MSTSLTSDEVYFTLTGFEEQAISKEFAESPLILSRQDRLRWLRAMAFVVMKRDGQKDKDAFKAAMEMPLGEIVKFFNQAEQSDEGKG